MKNKTILYILLLTFVLTPLSTSAQTPVSIPFGGTLLFSHECACSGGWMMYVWDKSKFALVPMVFQFGASRMNGNYNIYSPGTSNLGTYVAGGACVMASLECMGGPIPFGTVTPPPGSGIGTSLY